MKIFFRFKIGLKIALITTLGTVAFLSCKQEVLKPSVLPITKDVKAESLKIYLSKLHGVEIKLVEYNEETEMFSMRLSKM